MALSASFKYAIDQVDASILLASTIDTGYGLFEFSYSCSGSTYTIVGGSDVACSHGAVHLLDAMGFDFLAPTEQFWVKPAAPLPTNLTRTKTQFWIPDCSHSMQYGNNWEGPVGSWRAIMDTATNRWYDLVGWRSEVLKSGHRQNSVVTAFQSYFNANPHLIDSRVAGGKSFALATMTNAEKDYVATLGASYLLSISQSPTSALNVYKKTEYDAADGDLNTSNDYYAHAMLVCQKVREGTPAIQGNPAYAGVPGAELGVYAYAGHKPPPTFDLVGIYVAVALNFSPESSWLPRMEGYKTRKATAIMVRDYLDLPQYTTCVPMKGRRMDKEYPDKYDAYKAAGAQGMKGGDGNGNWLVNLVANRQLNMKLRTGSYTYTQARNDVVNGLFGGDAAVAALYDQWMDPFAKFHRFSLYQSMLLVDQMADGWYKTYFEQILVLAYLQLTRPPRPTSPVVGDAYDLALTKELKHAMGIALSQIFHSYGYLRIYASGNATGYPHLYYKNYAAPYYVPGNMTVPTHAEYLACRDALAPLASRDADLDSTDLIVMHNITPSWAGNPTPASAVNVTGIAQLAFIGPGTVNVSGIAFVDNEETGGYDSVPFSDPDVRGPGIHYLRYNDSYTYTPEDGLLFVSSFPLTGLNQAPTVGGVNLNYGDLWGYVPDRCAGSVLIEKSSASARFEDQLGSFDVTPSTPSNNSRMNNLGPRQVKVNGLLTTGGTSLTKMNQWLSMRPDKALLPLAIAEEDYPALGKIIKA